jgi:hypothetical protein
MSQSKSPPNDATPTRCSGFDGQYIAGARMMPISTRRSVLQEAHS